MPTTAQNTMASTNSPLTTMFTSLFGGPGGAGSKGIGALSSIASGSGTAALDKALTESSRLSTISGVAGLKEAFGSTGMGSSSSLAKSIGQFQTSQSSALQTNIAQGNLQAQGQQLSAANYLSQMFSSSANQYFNDSSSSFNPLQLISTLFGAGGTAITT